MPGRLRCNRYRATTACRWFARCSARSASSSSVSEEIVAKADGNPLFLEQLALHAGEEDLRSDLMVPNTIHDVVMARIDRLPDETKQLLQTAAVIGREFSSRLLSAVWEGRRRSKPTCAS